MRGHVEGVPARIAVGVGTSMMPRNHLGVGGQGIGRH